MICLDFGPLSTNEMRRELLELWSSRNSTQKPRPGPGTMKTSDGVGSLVLQATPEVDIVSIQQQVLNVGELVFTIAFDIEIAV